MYESSLGQTATRALLSLGIPIDRNAPSVGVDLW